MKFLREILIRVLNGETASSILTGLTPQNKGDVGEALFKILTLLGIHPTDPSSFITPYRSVTTTRRLEAISGISERLDILKTGLINAGASGKIDVLWRDGSQIAVCSSKIGMIKVKAIADLEIVPRLAEFTESGGYTENGKPVLRASIVPYVLVDNKDEVLRLAEKSKASNKVSKDNLNPFDIDDLNRMCAVLLERTERCASKDFEAILNHLLSDEKPSLRTRLHQKLICSKVMRLIRSGKKTILIGALPRSGKTYMGAFIAKHFKKILIITTRPGETRTQWNKVFKEHREFSAYKVMDLNSSSSAEIAISNKKGDDMVTIASIQFFKMDERDALIGLDWDLVLLDEIHEGGSTELSNEMLDKYIGAKPVRVMMTATYTKPVEYYSIPSECCCFWDLEDVRLMRSWGETKVFDRLCDKYGTSDITEARDDTYKSGETDASIRKCYTDAPRLGILTNIMQPTIYDELCVATGSPDNVYGFSMRSLLMPTKDGKAFQNQKAVDTFLAIISGSDKMKHYKKGDMSMFARITRYWKTIGHRDSDEFMTQIWFLPSGVGQLLEHVKSAMISRINANSILKHFATLTLDSGMGDISKTVTSAVVDAKAAGKKGLILLTGNVGSLGVSLPEVDVAFMLHDKESADMNYQQMMRVLTEMINKKYGIVVDFNVWRVLTTLNTYATSRCGQAEKSSADRISWCVSNLIDVDPDLWQCTESPESFPQEKIVDELTKQWRKMLEQTGSSLNTLARKPIDLGEDQKELDQIAKYLDEGSSKTTLEVNPDQEKLPSGIEPKGDCVSDDNEEEEVEDDTAKKANLNDVLARLIPEIAILSGKHDLLEAMEAINRNPKHREALNEFLIQLYG
jgi:superfamily II DNA or RNA helicase